MENGVKSREVDLIMTDSAISSTITELCVLCGTDTKISVNMPIACRSFYIVGCGQLCECCAAELAVERLKPDDELSEQDMKALLNRKI